jgi:hypothetical protein
VPFDIHWALRIEGSQMSLLGKLQAEILEVEAIEDPWLAPLQRVRGKVEFDGLERVSSQTLLDALEVPQRSRTGGTEMAEDKDRAHQASGSVKWLGSTSFTG